MYNVLTEPVIRYTNTEGDTLEVSLPRVYHALVNDDVLSFPALRPHQRHAWHSFLVQLAVIAMRKAGITEVPNKSSNEWLEIIQGLTREEFPDDSPWELVYTNMALPAFMQSPAPTREHAEHYKTPLPTPDAMDILVTARNHDVKVAVAKNSDVDDWIFSLVTLQTMAGVYGQGSYGISRMNGGFGNRAAFSLAPSKPTPGPHILRDIEMLVSNFHYIYKDQPTREGGHALLWTLPWGGETDEMLSVFDLHPMYIEVSRRVRLTSKNNGKLEGVRATSKTFRIDSKKYKGVLGDPWSPVDCRDKKQGAKVLTLPGDGFGYRRVTDFMLSEDYVPPTLLSPSWKEVIDNKPMRIVARAMVRGQGETAGYHERSIPVSTGFILGVSTSHEYLMDIAKERMKSTSNVYNILRHSIATYLAEGNSDFKAHSKGKPSLNEIAERWVDKWNSVIDDHFLQNMQDEFASIGLANDDTERYDTRIEWLKGLVEQAHATLENAMQALPCKTQNRFYAISQAEGVFWGRIRGENGVPELYPKEDATESTAEEEGEQADSC